MKSIPSADRLSSCKRNQKCEPYEVIWYCTDDSNSLISLPVPSIASTSSQAMGTTPANSNHNSAQSAFRPSIRPAEYPEEILWVLEDCMKHGVVSESNPSRPNMELCIRDRKGRRISASAYRGVRTTARMLIYRDLFNLPAPDDPAARKMKKTRTFYQRYYPEQYRALLTKLEEHEPLLTLCATQWKANHVVGQCLQGITEKDAKSNKKRKAEGGLTEDEGDDGKENRQARGLKKKRTKERSPGLLTFPPLPF